MKLRVVDINGVVKCESISEKEIGLLYTGMYQEGDKIVLDIDETEKFYVVSIDAAIKEALVYITKEEWEYVIPFGEKKVCYCPQAFEGELHYISAREAYSWEVDNYRNLALNPIDQHADNGCYPHAFANVETRGESVFAAKNAIDGCTANLSHGEWPYGSWGINRKDDAEIVVNFGREVWIDRLIIHTRADFPHDNWWVKATVEFSDETSMEIPLDKKITGQEIVLPEKKNTSWIKLKELIKADDPSPFPALTQIAVYGGEIN